MVSEGWWEVLSFRTGSRWFTHCAETLSGTDEFTSPSSFQLWEHYRALVNFSCLEQFPRKPGKCQFTYLSLIQDSAFVELYLPLAFMKFCKHSFIGIFDMLVKCTGTREYLGLNPRLYDLTQLILPVWTSVFLPENGKQQKKLPCGASVIS